MGARVVTLLFTDIAGSTRLLERLGDRYLELISEHDRVVREGILACHGREVRTAGDSFFAVFANVADAVRCALRVQVALANGVWPGGEPPQVRMGIHTGSPAVRDGGFEGMDVHRAARVMAVAHGGQVLLTDDARHAVGTPVSLRDLGFHRLKDLPEPEHLFQLVAPELPGEFPPLQSLNRSNLPVPGNPLIGRQLEVGQALEMLMRPGLRLVTLLGPGGVGKTRVAIEVGAEAASRYRDGVWLVLLAPVAHSGLVVAEVAKVLGVDPVGGQTLEETLLAALAGRELLLVLDNFEHLLTAAADLVAELLAAAPGVDVLVASREPLRIHAEHRLEVPPLALEHASELFMQRALAVRPELSLANGDRAAVERICARLDGLPLALELAAARTAVFGPRALESRLAQGFTLPAGPRDLPERQRTLTATIDWSYRLLGPDERALLTALAPFIGGVRVDSAESLWGGGAVDRLAALAEKSLLRRRDDPDGEPRFWMLETVREFAQQRATSEGTAAELADRHAAYYLALAEEVGPRLVTTDQARWLDRLEAELANIRTALDRLTTSAPERALRMVGHLSRFWEIRGYIPEGRRRLGEALAATPVAGPEGARALFGAGRLAFMAGDAGEAVPLLRRAAASARAAGDTRLAAEALANIDAAAVILGDPGLGDTAGEEAIAVARSAGDDWALGIALNNRANACIARGDLTSARPLLQESLELRRRSGESRGIAITSYNLAQLTLGAGELDATQALLDSALEHARAIDYHSMITGLLAIAALLALHRQNPILAQSRLADAIEAMHTPEQEILTDLFAAAAAVAAMHGQPLDAAVLWGAADAKLIEIGRVEAPGAAAIRAKWLSQARAQAADQNEWDAARKAGAELSDEQAVSIARACAMSADPDVLR
jgi:predicted ATPase/class 3 adenylate cyclase